MDKINMEHAIIDLIRLLLLYLCENFQFAQII